jgi:hypothetical protein
MGAGGEGQAGAAVWRLIVRLHGRDRWLPACADGAKKRRSAALQHVRGGDIGDRHHSIMTAKRCK